MIKPHLGQSRDWPPADPHHTSSPAILISVQAKAMIANHATPQDFARWEAKAKAMTMAELVWSAQDARKAEAAMRGWNPIAEGRYSDEASTYGDEIRRRRARA